MIWNNFIKQARRKISQDCVASNFSFTAWIKIQKFYLLLRQELHTRLLMISVYIRFYLLFFLSLSQIYTLVSSINMHFSAFLSFSISLTYYIPSYISCSVFYSTPTLHFYLMNFKRDLSQWKQGLIVTSDCTDIQCMKQELFRRSL
jgi:hypothetical protein